MKHVLLSIKSVGWQDSNPQDELRRSLESLVRSSAHTQLVLRSKVNIRLSQIMGQHEFFC